LCTALLRGIGVVSTDFTNFLMAIADVPSKTIWGLLGRVSTFSRHFAVKTANRE
jgi:hypothetical protein